MSLDIRSLPFLLPCRPRFVLGFYGSARLGMICRYLRSCDASFLNRPIGVKYPGRRKMVCCDAPMGTTKVGGRLRTRGLGRFVGEVALE